VNDENGDLLADSHNILNRQKNYFSQLLNDHTLRAINIYIASSATMNRAYIKGKKRGGNTACITGS
jgi:hypothetical protein